MNKTILFNHIPKTGGTTLRVILNRVYGEEHVYFIESKNIGGSLEKYKNLKQEDRDHFKVVAGHAAGLFEGAVNNPFRITVLREPVSLFLSQYAYLKVSSNSVYLDQVKALNSIDEYIDFAIEKGQDNMQTRLLSGKAFWLTDPKSAVPNMDNEGEQLLDLAQNNLISYHAILDLKRFESGVYMLGKTLQWKHIPVYRPVNVNRKKKEKVNPNKKLRERLNHILRYDIALYNYFRENNLDIANTVSKHDYKYRVFQMRQTAITRMSKFTKR